MTDVYFHYSNAHGVLIDRSGTAVDDLVGARKHTDCVARSLIMTASAEDGAAGSSTSPTMKAMRSLRCRSRQCSANRTRRVRCARKPRWHRSAAA